ncbi:MAG: CTP synthase (glutamine hydrolyzing) [Nanoarchaeota archaeon]|nr:CTP synthase (glutamine hydrolyzing) [Nanoarchaeota archaeon]
MLHKKEDFEASNIPEEFYSPMPAGYRIGQTKYIVITGSVISGIGKGTISSTLAKLLHDRKMKVEPMKLEAYLNVDAGTLNPFRHGEVFVLDDGTETDLDLGTYERLLDKSFTKDNFVTSGRIYSQIIEKERAGKYLGKDVQFIPHVTGEIKLAVRNLAVKTGADVILIEIGGTVGDYENMFAMEALRELSYEEGKENVCFINVTYILEPGSLGEQKSKAAQLGIKALMEIGIQPDVIVCRSESPIGQSVKEKISLHANVSLRRVFGVHDIKNIYLLPLDLRDEGFDDAVCEILNIKEKFHIEGNGSLQIWNDKMNVDEKEPEIVIGIAGKYLGASDTYASITKSLEHCSFFYKKNIKIKWIDTAEIERGTISVQGSLNNVHGLIVPGGFGSRGVEGKISCIKYCRENNIPFLGLCYGFQLALVEYARNVCELEGAHTAEIDPHTRYNVIDILPEQKSVKGFGGSMRLGGKDVFIKPGTIARRIHNSAIIRRRFRHRYECNPEFIETFEKKGMVFSGCDEPGKIMQILEIPNHRFFMAAQFHPEFTSRPGKPDEIFLEFVRKAGESKEIELALSYKLA